MLPREVRGRARRQRVENDHVVDALVRQQLWDQRAPDVAAAAGDEDAVSRPDPSLIGQHAGQEPVLVGGDPVLLVDERSQHVADSLFQRLLLSTDQIEEPVVLHLHFVFLVPLRGFS